MELQDKEKKYERNIWESYRKEWATAGREKRVQLNKRMFRWQELMKNGWAASQAYYKAIEEEPDKPPRYPLWSWMRKAPFIIMGLALVAAIVYSVVITRDRNTLNTELESVQSVLASTQSELSSMKQTLASTQVELSSMKQTLASIQTELSSTKQSLTSTQGKLEDTEAELSSTKQSLTSTQTQLSSTKQSLISTQINLASVQNELETTKAKLETTEAELELYKETLGGEVFSGVPPPYQKGGLGTSLEINLNINSTAANPTWQQLINFLRTDPTDDETYRESTFNCINFAEMLHNNAEAAEIKAAFVAVFYQDEDEGHALNAFMTTDKGLVYVDCTGPTLRERLYERLYQSPREWDRIAYVMKGEEYGMVSIDRATSPEYWFYNWIGKSSESGWLPPGIVESIKIYW